MRPSVAAGLVVLGTPLLAGSPGTIWIADEAIGPAITLVVWIAMFAQRALRARGDIYAVEWIAVVGSVVVLQLLLDLHTRHLGDIVIIALHLGFVVAVAIGAVRRKWKTRSTARPSASGEANGG